MRVIRIGWPPLISEDGYFLKTISLFAYFFRVRAYENFVALEKGTYWIPNRRFWSVLFFTILKVGGAKHILLNISEIIEDIIFV